MELCNFCRDINLRAVFPPYLHARKGFKHQPDLVNMIQAARLGCELCQFFLKCAEELSRDEFEKVRNGGQLYLRGSLLGECYICSEEKAPLSLAPRLCNFYCFAPDLKVSQLIKLEVEAPSADSSSDICFAKIASWLKQCTTKHPDCGKPCEVVLPTRVIDVGSFDNQNIRLVTTNGSRGSWVALSHCWGNSVSLQLKRRCLTEMEKSIQIESLPPSFQDAVHITRRLGFKYLWIDSLCIIQDSPEDWAQESGQMASIYSNSVLTIAAEAARDDSIGIFRSANMCRPKFSVKVKGHWNNHAIDHVWFRSPSLPDSGGFHLHQRAWVLQETLLAPRVLTYTSEQLFYTCRTTQYNEFEPSRSITLGSNYPKKFVYHNERCRLAKKILFRASSFYEQPVMAPETMNEGCLDSYSKVPNNDRTSQRPSKFTPKITVEEVLQQWFKIVEAFTVRSLTFETDRLPALAGVAKVVGRLTDYSYKAGLWDEDLIRGLAWSINKPSTDGYRRARCSDYVAPSWSWASIPSRVRLVGGDEVKFPLYFEAAQDTTVLETHLEYFSDDPYLGVSSGLLKIRGRCRSLEPKDFGASSPQFGWSLDDDLHSHLYRKSTDDGVNRLFLHLGKEGGYHIALILKETDLHGTYKRIGRWVATCETEILKNWTIKTLTII